MEKFIRLEPKYRDGDSQTCGTRYFTYYITKSRFCKLFLKEISLLRQLFVKAVEIKPYVP